MATLADDPIDSAVLEPSARFTLEQYHRMGESGALGPEPRRCELLRGVVVSRMREGHEHSQSCVLIDDLLHRVVPAGFFVSMGHPHSIKSQEREPVPDAMVVRGEVRGDKGRCFTASDTPLVIEVSQSSLEYDRMVKRPIDAASGVPEFWIVNLRERVLEIDQDPVLSDGKNPATYQRTTIKSARGQVRLTLDGDPVVEFFVRDILP